MNRISKLFFRRFTGTITKDEETELREWISEGKAHSEVAGRLEDPDILEKEYRMRSLIDSQRAEREMRDYIRRQNRPVRIRRMAIAASFTLIATVSALIYFTLSEKPPGEVIAKAETAVPGEIRPGETGAVLTASSGEKIELKGLEGEATPSAIRSALASVYGSSHVPRRLSLEVAPGQEFKIMLEDSTEVWLNSASTLNYPENFLASERCVEIIGEAYFNVRKDASRPFVVNAGGQTITVTGTTFNVRCYPEDGYVTTTLESGSVSLSGATADTGRVNLKPGHQAVLDKGSSVMKVREVDTETFTGWRHGRFVFEDQTLGVIMCDLSRWYNFSYTFTDPGLSELEFMGSIPRYSDFATAVTILENSGGLEFRIDGREVTVSKK